MSGNGNGPVGEMRACGGIALMRVKAFEAVGGFREDLIAGEEPELCVRLRARGWRIWRLDSDMALHDAAMNRFAQWWQRNMRSGYSFAQGAYLHGALPERHYVWESLRPWFWGICLPLVCLLAGLTFGFWGWVGIADLSIACSAKGGSQPRPFGPSCAAGSVLCVGTLSRELGRNQVLARSSAWAPGAPHRIQVMPLWSACIRWSARA